MKIDKFFTGKLGELAETTPLLRVQAVNRFGGSNPSLSAKLVAGLRFCAI